MSVRELSEAASGTSVSGPSVTQPSPTPSPSRILKKKEKTFKASLTRDALMLLLLYTVPIAALAWQGADNVLDGHGRGAILLGSALGLFLIGGCFVMYQLGRSLRVTPDRLIYAHGRRLVSMAWGDMKKFYPPPQVQTHFRMLRVGDGQDEIVIDSVSFADFDLLVSLVTVARKRKLADKDHAYHL